MIKLPKSVKCYDKYATLPCQGVLLPRNEYQTSDGNLGPRNAARLESRPKDAISETKKRSGYEHSYMHNINRRGEKIHSVKRPRKTVDSDSWSGANKTVVQNQRQTLCTDYLP